MDGRPRLTHTILVTNDLPRLRRFYVEIIRLVVIEERHDYIQLDAGGTYVALRCADRHYDARGDGGSVQVAFRVLPAEVDEWAERFAAADVDVVEPPTDQPWGHRTLFASDPDGNLVEIYADL